jgi:hypothetical protein
MTWRLNKYMVEGELDNTNPGRVTGWLRFAGMRERVIVALEGDFRSDIRGMKVQMSGRYLGSDAEAVKYMDGFALHQTGRVGNMTAGMPPADWTPYPYFEWFSDVNERVVLDPEPYQVHVVLPSVMGGTDDGPVPPSL